MVDAYSISRVVTVLSTLAMRGGGVGVGVGVGVDVGVGIAVVGMGVGIGSGLAVAAGIGTAVDVGTGAGVSVGVDLGAGAGVGVGVELSSHADSRAATIRQRSPIPVFRTASRMFDRHVECGRQYGLWQGSKTGTLSNLPCGTMPTAPA